VSRKLEVSYEEELVRGEALPPGETAGELPADVAMKVLALYGHRCAHCGRDLDVQIHHVIFRSKGGTNRISNCICLCRRCHAAVHDLTLEVFQDSLGNLYWRTRADKLTALLQDEEKECSAIPSTPAPSRPPAPAAVSSEAQAIHPEPLPATAIEKPKPLDPAVRREAENIERLLVEFGYGKPEAHERVWNAVALLADLGRSPTGDEILNTAIYQCRLDQGVPKFAHAEPAGGRGGEERGDHGRAGDVRHGERGPTS
jgi:hypothetical protein